LFLSSTALPSQCLSQHLVCSFKAQISAAHAWTLLAAQNHVKEQQAQSSLRAIGGDTPDSTADVEQEVTQSAKEKALAEAQCQVQERCASTRSWQGGP
jgi:hypothetical protein